MNIGLVSYSPLGHGFLTGRWKSVADMPEGDTRAGCFPRFEEENFRKNLEPADKVREIADEKDVTPGQLALARLLHRGDDIVPIPGTKRREQLGENAAAADVTLTDEDLRRMEKAIPRGSSADDRYYEQQMRAVNR